MSKELPTYPEYKDTGLPWMGNIPSHWQLERGKWIFHRVERSVRPSDEVVTCFRDGTVTLRKKRRTMGFTNSLKEIGYQGVRRGDLVIHAMDAFAGAVGVSDSDGKCTPVYAVCVPKADVNPQFYVYVVREMARSQWIAALARGIRERSTDFRFDTFADQPLPLPPREEQNAAVAFLDRQDRHINRFIRNRQRLVERLNEQKQAIINRAVTRGLDPNARLKPSGIDWLGEIPEHWEVKRLKHTLLRPLKYGANAAAELTDRSLPRYIRITDIDKNGQLIDNTFRSIEREVAEPYMLNDGDILLARSGATVGKSFLYSEKYGPAAYAGYLINARVDPAQLRPRFLYAVLQSAGYWRWVTSITIQATIQNVSADKYANLYLPVPPIHEQEAILSDLNHDIPVVEDLIRQAQEEIDLIREYRTRLIADVVTGKVDVRHLAPADGESTGTDPAGLGEAIDAEVETTGELETVEGATDEGGLV